MSSALKKVLLVLLIGLAICISLSAQNRTDEKVQVDIKVNMPVAISLLGYGGEASVYTPSGIRSNIGFTFITNEYWWVGSSQSNSEDFKGMPLMFGDVSYCFINSENVRTFLGIGWATQQIQFSRHGTVDVDLSYFSNSPYIVTGIAFRLLKVISIEVDYFAYMDWFSKVTGQNTAISRYGIDNNNNTVLMPVNGGFKFAFGVSL